MTHRETSTAESGFTIIEVVIAVMLLAVIATGVSLAVVGGTRLQGQAKVNASLASASRKVVENLRSDRDWMNRTDCRNTNPSASCNLLTTGPGSTWSFDTSQLVDNDLAVTWKLTTLTAKGVDSSVDGVGAQDKDGVIPDYFRISLVISPPDPVTRTRLGNIPDLKFTTALDERGNIPHGSVEVDICRVRNQIDERMTISDCGTSLSGSGIRMDACPPAPLLGCTSAWNSVSARPRSLAAPSPNVELTPVSGASFKLQNIQSGKTYSSGGHELTSQGLPGRYLFENLDSGTYRVIYTAIPGGTVRWPSHEIPTDGGNVSVEPDSRAKSLILLRPAAFGNITVNFRREITKYTLVGEWKPCDPVYGHDLQPASCNRKHELVHQKPTGTYVGRKPSPCDGCANQYYVLSADDGAPAACFITDTADPNYLDHTSSAYITQCEWWRYPDAIEDGIPGKNCVTQYYWASHNLGDKNGGDSYFPAADLDISFFGFGIHLYAYETWYYCSYYDTWLQHHIWHEDPGQRSTFWVPGAYKSATYWMHAAPDHRQLMNNHHNPQPSGSPDIPNETVRVTSNPSDYMLTSGGGVPPSGSAGPYRPASSCFNTDNGDDRQTFTRGCDVTGYSSVLNGSASRATTQIRFRFLPPGLYSRIMGSSTNPSDVGTNANLGNTQPSVVGGSGGIWVNPTGWAGCGGTGTISGITAFGIACTGTSNLTALLSGKGECYWRTLPNYPAWKIGKCDPCQPHWAPKNFDADECFLLDKSRCRRMAYVMKGFHNPDGSVYTESIWTDSINWKTCQLLTFNPPLECTSGDPRADLSGCHPPAPIPPPRTSFTTHTLNTPDGGTVTVHPGGDATTLG